MPCVLIPSNANPCVFQSLHFVKSWISLTQKFKITILFSPISFDHTSHYSFWAVIILCTLQRVSQSTAKNTAVPLCCTAAQFHTAAYSSSASIEKLFKSIYFSSKVTLALNFKVKLMANSVWHWSPKIMISMFLSKNVRKKLLTFLSQNHDFWKWPFQKIMEKCKSKSFSVSHQ